MRDLISIIGAGTSGLIAARRLGELGFESTLYDQKPVLGLPVRASGILSLTGMKSLGMNYSGCVTNTLYGANVHSGGKILRVVSKKPVASVLDRKRLNDACYDQAVKAGARLITKRVTGSGLDLLAGKGILIGADGAVSSVAKHFGFGEIKKFVVTYKAEFDAEAPESGVVDLYIDRGEYGGLFAWTCPNGNNLLEVGVGIYSSLGNAKTAFDRFAGNGAVAELVKNRKPVTEGASIIPLDMRRRIVDEKRGVMLVGDAAGQVKPTTGGGVIFGGNGALIAADTIAKHLENGSALSDYETEFRRRYGLDLKLHSAIKRFYSSLGPSAMGGVITVLNALGIDRFLSVYGDMDRPSLILKRFFLRGLVG
jgi:flavin-dependent dehydrogenase